MFNFEDAIKGLISTPTPESSFYLSHLNEEKKNQYLIEKSFSLLKEDMLNSFKKREIGDTNKINFINDVFSKIESIKPKGEKNGATDKLRTFINDKEINSFKPKFSKISKFIREYDASDKDTINDNSKVINETYNLSVSLSNKMNEKRTYLEIHHYDIFKYLIDKKISNDFRYSTIKKIEGDYLLFRNSERNSDSINISILKLRYNYTNNVFSFKSERKGFIKSNKLEDISTQGIFFQNSASTFVFLCRSVTSSNFAFIETITVLSTRPKNKNYIVALFSGEIMSNNDYDNRPFSSKAVLVKVESKAVVKKIEDNNSLIDHPISRVEKISEIIDSDEEKRERKKREEKISKTEFKNTNSSYNIELVDKEENKIREGVLYNSLIEINKITSLSLILSKIKTEVDKHFHVMILKN